MAPQGYQNVSLTTDGKLALTRIAARVRTCIGEDGDALNLSEAVRVVERLLAAHRDTDPIKLREDLRDAASRAGVRITAGEGVSDPLPVVEAAHAAALADQAIYGTGQAGYRAAIDALHVEALTEDFLRHPAMVRAQEIGAAERRRTLAQGHAQNVQAAAEAYNAGELDHIEVVS